MDRFIRRANARLDGAVAFLVDGRDAVGLWLRAHREPIAEAALLLFLAVVTVLAVVILG